MTRTATVVFALILAAPAAAQLSDPLAPELAAKAAPPAEDAASLREKVRDCEGERFVFAWGVGARPTKVTLCGEKGATPDELARMIEDAATKVAATVSIPEDRRKAIVQQMEARAATLRKTPVTALPSPARTGAVEPPIAPTVGPMPVAKPVQRPSILRPPPAKPRLSLECMTPGEFSRGGPCVTMTRDTVLIVKAGEALPDPIALRFVRSGDTRGEVALGSMRKGQSVRNRVPREVCSGISSGEAQIHVIRSGQVADRLGPYLLRC